LRIAQTNLQLYQQLSERAADSSDLAIVRRGYELAASLFAGVYRASGKPFIAHLVGTADILIQDRAPLAFVTAGLLHAAYAQGDFGDGVPGPTETRRRQVVNAIGADAERLVARYTAMAWKGGDLSGDRNRPDSLDALDRKVLRIRLANEVEEISDFGILHHRDAEIRRSRALEALPVWIGWARALSANGIAEALESLKGPLATFCADEALRTERVQSYRAQAVLRPTVGTRARRAIRGLRSVGRRLRSWSGSDV
jgi:hypothetical protein